MCVRRLAVLTVVVPAIWASGMAAAGAHVTVRPASEPAGTAYSVLTFRVPNEMNDASTVKVEIFLPTAAPVKGVSVRPVAGWKVRATPAKITWSGGRIPVGGYQDFDVLVGQVPDEPGPLVFKALQTYGNGEVVRWIETAPEGSPEPEHPAPTVQLTEAADDSADEPGDGTDRTLAIIALGVAVIALYVAVAGRLRRTPRRD